MYRIISIAFILLTGVAFKSSLQAASRAPYLQVKNLPGNSLADFIKTGHEGTYIDDIVVKVEETSTTPVVTYYHTDSHSFPPLEGFPKHPSVKGITTKTLFATEYLCCKR